MNELPRLAAKMRGCGPRVVFDAHVHELKELIQNPWMMKLKPKRKGNTAVWPATDDPVKKWRPKVVRRALSTDRIATDQMEKRRLYREI